MNRICVYVQSGLVYIKLRSIGLVTWLTDEAEALPLGAVMVKTPSLLMLELTRSPFTPVGKVNFCSKTRVLKSDPVLAFVLRIFLNINDDSLLINQGPLKTSSHLRYQIYNFELLDYDGILTYFYFNKSLLK